VIHPSEDTRRLSLIMFYREWSGREGSDVPPGGILALSVASGGLFARPSVLADRARHEF
jgi:hypothetical protein